MADEKQQFNVYLPSDVIRAVKHAAIDDCMSLSGFVEHALRAQLERREALAKASMNAVSNSTVSNSTVSSLESSVTEEK
jgi:hypothetical protein